MGDLAYRHLSFSRPLLLLFALVAVEALNPQSVDLDDQKQWVLSPQALMATVQGFFLVLDRQPAPHFLVADFDLLRAGHHQISDFVNFLRLLQGVRWQGRKYQVVGYFGAVLGFLSEDALVPDEAGGAAVREQFSVFFRRLELGEILVGLHPHDLVDDVEPQPVEQVIPHLDFGPLDPNEDEALLNQAFQGRELDQYFDGQAAMHDVEMLKTLHEVLNRNSK